MTEAERQDSDEISLFAVGTMLLRSRWRIVRWMFIGAAVTALSVFSRPSLYLASASFFPQVTDASRSDLASLAGRFGLSVPGGTPSLSSDFYTHLLRSSVLLQPIARDTFVVEEMGGQQIPFLDLFGIQGGTTIRREEQGVTLLTGIVTASVIRVTGVVELSVATKWPSVSLAITTALVNGVDEFNRETRQGRAAAEREFVEERLAVAGAELREAEDRLERFLISNRQFSSSPELTFERDRLQRDVSLHQQLFTSLTQAYEEVRIREVRDTPVITMIEPPSVPTLPDPRGRVKSVVVGFLVGGVVGVLMAFASGIIAGRREQGDAEVEEFSDALRELRSELRTWFRPISRS